MRIAPAIRDLRTSGNTIVNSTGILAFSTNCGATWGIPCSPRRADSRDHWLSQTRARQSCMHQSSWTIRPVILGLQRRSERKYSPNHVVGFNQAFDGKLRRLESGTSGRESRATQTRITTLKANGPSKRRRRVVMVDRPSGPTNFFANDYASDYYAYPPELLWKINGLPCASSTRT